MKRQTKSKVGLMFDKKRHLACVIGIISLIPAFGRSTESADLPRLYQDGDVIIGMFLPMHESANENDVCSSVSLYSILLLETILFTIRRINRAGLSMGGMQIGYDVRDTCLSMNIAMKQGLNFVANVEYWSRAHSMSPGVVAAINTSVTPVRGATGVKPEFPVKENSKTHATFCNEKPIMGIIGAIESHEVSIALAGLMSLYRVPMISFLTTASTLSDTYTYPSFYRTIPSDEKLTVAIVDLVKHFDWNYISVITTDNEYGREGRRALKSRLTHADVCLAHDDLYDPTSGHQQVVNIISSLKADEYQSAAVVILFMHWRYAKLFLNEAYKQGLEGKTWLLSQAWSATHEIVQLPPNLAHCIIGLSLPSQLSRTRQYEFLKYMLKQRLHGRARYNPWLAEYARTKLKCNLLGSRSATGHWRSEYDDSLKNCSMDLTLEKLLRHETLSVTVNAANAILTFVEAMDMAIAMEKETMVRDRWFNHEVLNRYVSQVDFHGAGDVHVKFDENGDIVGAQYHILNVQESNGQLELFSIGKWEMKQGQGELAITDDGIQWINGTRPASRCSKTCQPGYLMTRSPSVCCWDCQRCPEGTISNTTKSATCNKCDQFYHTNKNRSECLPNAEKWVHHYFLRIPITAMGSVGLLSVLTITGIVFIFRDLVLIRRTELKYAFLLVVFTAQLYPFTHLIYPTTTICTVQICLLSIPAALLPVVLISQTKPTLRTSGRILRRLLRQKIAKRFVQMFTFCTIGVVSLGFCMLSFSKGLPSIDKTVIEGGHTTFLSCEDPFMALEVIPVISQTTLLILATYIFERENGETEETRDSIYNGIACYVLVLCATVLLPVYLAVTSKQAKIILLTIWSSTAHLTSICLKFLPQLYDIFIMKDRRVLGEIVITIHAVASQIEDADAAQKDTIP